MRKYLSYLLTLTLLLACQKEPLQEFQFPGETLILFYTCGHDNGLDRNITGNLNEILEGSLPSIDSQSEVVHFLQHANGSAPRLLRLGAGQGGKNTSREIQLEEMRSWDENSISISSDTLAQVLNYISRQYTARHNYLVLSSHGTGWLPAGTYDAGSAYTYKENTFGQDLQGGRVVYEMGIRQMAGRLPMHFDAILFDACLMGGIEVAYEFRDKCRIMGFSPTEILAHGMYYQTMCSHLLAGDVLSVAQDYMKYYRNRSGLRSATYTLVDCGRLDGLADACRTIFTGHREEMEAIQPALIQGYFRDDHPWYFDLRNVAVHLQATDGELDALDKALGQAVLFADHTDYFLGLKLENCCGLSTYLPACGNRSLNTYYRPYKWNQDTQYLE